MKITIITPYWKNSKGGITTVAISLADVLREQGNRVFVLTPDSGDGAIRLPQNRLLLCLSMIFELMRLSPDSIHVHGHGFLLLPAIMYKKIFKRGVKLVFTFHTQPRKELAGSEKERGRIRLAVVNRLLGGCDVVTCVSNNLKESLLASGIAAGDLLVVANGVAKKSVAAKEVEDFRRRLGIGGEYPVLCMVASLVWDWKAKGVEILIAAFGKVSGSLPDARLLIVGDGKYKKGLEDFAAQKNLKEGVIFTGEMDDPFVALAASDIYCHISLNEAMPIAPLEAMACGLPVVASNNGGLPEIIKNGVNGVLSASDPGSVAEAILRLAQNRELMESMSRNASNMAETDFSWNRIAFEYLKLYGAEIK